ncbi:MAG: adenylyltransferase/cytidyltransferase family protein [Kiritimatiellia bacterium]
MKPSSSPGILTPDAACRERRRFAEEGRKVVFTNGCFDILHRGHVEYLDFAATQGDVLIVGINSDDSIRRIKGEGRPVTFAEDRARVLRALACVDAVVIFDEDEPGALIEKLLPDVLVKGEDWKHYVSGREAVERHGGHVVLAPLSPGYSTSGLIRKIRDSS